MKRNTVNRFSRSENGHYKCDNMKIENGESDSSRQIRFLFLMAYCTSAEIISPLTAYQKMQKD
jgi:hypothetical protein